MSEASKRLSSPTYLTFLTWSEGKPVTDLSKATFYRHRSQILEITGCDISRDLNEFQSLITELLAQTPPPPPQSAWTLRLRGASGSWHTAYLLEKDECFVSANTKLCDIKHAVSLSSEQLANDFATAIQPVMRKRHGDRIYLWSERCNFRADFDDDLVKRRISARQFAPNKLP